MDTLNARVIAGRGTPEAAWRAWDGLAALPSIDPEQVVPAGSRAVFVAPHPDDEILSMGGLMALLARQSRELLLVAVTDGDASHRDSPAWPTDRLRAERPLETGEALRRLGVHDIAMRRLGIGDGTVRHVEDTLCSSLEPLLTPTDVVITTWRHDGHPDHEATGRAVARACAARGATWVETPVWMWHWAQPGDARVPWHRARRLALDAGALASKRHATQAFSSQIEDDSSTGSEAILAPYVLDRLLRDFELVFI
jgi:LmbE family N-acetylglucosaminyl deacetylase